MLSFFAKVPYFTAFQLSDINECLPNPCHNGATCVDLIGNYRCNCKAGYTGGNCETGSKFLIEQLISIRFVDSSIVYLSSQYYFFSIPFHPHLCDTELAKLTMTSPSKHKICQATNNPTSGTNIYLLASINRTLQLLAPFLHCKWSITFDFQTSTSVHPIHARTEGYVLILLENIAVIVNLDTQGASAKQVTGF